MVSFFCKASYLDKVDSEDGVLYSTICGGPTTLRDKSRPTVATGPTSIWQQLDLYASMEIPSIIFSTCPMDDHQLLPHNPCVQMRQIGFGLCCSSLLMSNFKYSHMEEVT